MGEWHDKMVAHFAALNKAKAPPAPKPESPAPPVEAAVVEDETPAKPSLSERIFNKSKPKKKG